MTMRDYSIQTWPDPTLPTWHWQVVTGNGTRCYGDWTVVAHGAGRTRRDAYRRARGQAIQLGIDLRPTDQG